MEKEQLTGYPHLDNVHKKYYGEKGQQKIDTNKTMYQYIKERSEGFEGNAISFYGQKITYNELYANILKYAKAFHALGVSQGDRVTVLLPSMPETYFAFYGLDMLGAARNMVDLRTSEEGIKKYITETDSEFLLCLDSFSPFVAKRLLKTTPLKRIITTNAPLISIRNDLKRKIGAGVIWAQQLGYKAMGENVFLQEDFLRTGAYIPVKGLEAPYVPNATTLYMHTSGTMKFPKTIMSTDEAQNFVSAEYEKCLLPLEERDRFLAIMPPWILYGIMGFHMPFAKKMEVFPIPDPSSEKIDKLILEVKPNLMAGVPNHYIQLYESPLITDDTDLSFAKVFVCGGTAIVPEKQEGVSNFLQRHGAPTLINPGYSFSENTSIGSASQCEYNKLGSVGILLPDIECMIIDPETKKPLKYNETGMICLRGDLMQGYLGDEEETKKVLQVIEGKEWAVSGDIGHMDEEGFLFIDGREKNLIIGPDGFKIAPSEIESKICKHPEVKCCTVFGRKHPDYEDGDQPVAFIELKEKERSRHEIRRIVTQIKAICDRELSSYYRPAAFYVGKVIMTPMMKEDVGAMKNEFKKEESKGAIKKLITGSKIYR